MQETIDDMETILALASLARKNRIMILDLNSNPIDPSKYSDSELVTRILNDEFLFQTPKLN